MAAGFLVSRLLKKLASTSAFCAPGAPGLVGDDTAGAAAGALLVGTLAIDTDPLYTHINRMEELAPLQSHRESRGDVGRTGAAFVRREFLLTNNH